MRYKEHTLRKLEGQIMKLRSLQRSIEMTAISGTEAINQLDNIVKELTLIVERIDLEPNE